MKKVIIILVFLALISPVFAQNTTGDYPHLYYVNVPVERIFPTSSGYIVQYRSSSNVIGTIGIPIEWFNASASKAEFVHLDNPRGWPTMSIFYNNGEFSHVRLYFHRSRSHQTWSTIPNGTDVSRFFGDKEAFNIQF